MESPEAAPSSKKRKMDTQENTKLHKFESFSHRIAKFKVDPVAQLRRHKLDVGEPLAMKSFFHEELERWQDLNTSLNFTNFVREAIPLCNSLPQVIHFEDAIVDLLARYIEKKDALSLEPLLKLVVQLARDLEARFEKHFGRMVALLSSVASTHSSVEVIEWSFNCLACLFKLLSKLLVPDLRPTYDLMAPLLGKEQQKPFVGQFAAEAMAHLTRKAAAFYSKDQTPLRQLVDHAIADLEVLRDSKYQESYQQGIILMFATAVRGIKDTVHSCASAILDCIILSLATRPNSRASSGEQVLSGIIVLLVQHADVDTAHPVTRLLNNAVDEIVEKNRVEIFEVTAEILFTAAAVRNGSRIRAWSSLLDVSGRLLHFLAKNDNPPSDQAIWRLLAAVALILQHAPFDTVTPHVRHIMEQAIGEQLSPFFLSFSSFFIEQGQDRFRSLVLPYFQRFVTKYWEKSEAGLFVLIPKLIDHGALAGNPRSAMVCPPEWQGSLAKAFDGLEDSLVVQEGLLEIPSISIDRLYGCTTIIRSVAMGDAVRSKIRDRLASLLRTALTSSLPHNDLSAFAAGAAFECYAYCSDTESVDMLLWSALCNGAGQFSRSPRFLRGLLAYIDLLSRRLDVRVDLILPMCEEIANNLSGPSPLARLLSLRVLRQIHKLQSHSESQALSLAVTIEETPLGLDTARIVSMHIRNLPKVYTQERSRPLVRKAIPRFCCGLVNLRFGPLEQDIQATLAAIAAIDDSHDTDIAQVIFSWLEHPEDSSTSGRPSRNFEKSSHTFEVGDASLRRLRQSVQQVEDEMDQAADVLHKDFLESHKPAPGCSTNARMQALQIFQRVPQMAERRSRRLVPYLLHSTDGEDMMDTTEKEDDFQTDVSAAPHSTRFTRREQKALLEVFSKFVNPRALFRSEDVYTTLLQRLCNGDTDLQKSALEAILTWKNPRVLPYRERLRGLLDEARFAEEISSFVQEIHSSEGVSSEDRTELMPLVLRILYGRLVARKGAGSRNRSMEGKRKMILKALSETSMEELHCFVQIALSPLGNIDLDQHTLEKTNGMPTDGNMFRKQIGVLNTIEELTNVLGKKITPLAEELLRPVLFCLAGATRSMGEIRHNQGTETADLTPISASKQIRQIGYQCLNALFVSCADFDWQPHMRTIFNFAIDPRVEKFPIETAQSPSGLFQLFVTWSGSINTVLYLCEYNRILPEKISECLVIPSAKDPVKLSALQVLTNIATLLDEPDESSKETKERIIADVIQPNIVTFVTRIGVMLRADPGKDVLESAVRLLTQLARHVKNLPEIRSLLETITFLLGQPARRVNARTKVALLQTLLKYLPLAQFPADDPLQREILFRVSSLFDFFTDRASRHNLGCIIEVIAESQVELEEVAKICIDLNSFTPGRIEEPDFERRLKAFDAVNGDHLRGIPIDYWRPILYNLLFFMRDSEEFALRSNASHALRRFLQMDPSSPEAEPAYMALVSQVVLPAMYQGAKETSEVVRAEYVTVMAQIVRSFPSLDDVGGLEVLLAGGDEEASFFNNILHIQQHRRVRALQRLSGFAAHGHLDSKNIRHFFMPLIEHFIFQEKQDENSHNLAAEAVSTFGALVEWIEWRHCRSYLKKLIDRFRGNKEPEKVVIKMLGVVADALRRAAARKMGSEEVGKPKDDQDRAAMEEETQHGPAVSTSPSPLLAATLPSDAAISEQLMAKGSLPCLATFLRNKDDSLVSVRVLTAVVYVKFLKLFPADQLALHLPPILTDISYILRSRAPESRDATRKTLIEIATILGPHCFGFILKELRGALTRGYQLHVLSFTMHALLVTTVPEFSPGDLDYCLPEVIQVVMDDVFGTVGEEKDAEGYISSMKEVKSSKSYDSLELMAKMTTLSHLPDLTKPIYGILQQHLSLSLLRKVDELLRRISNGIAQNSAVQHQGLLVFCYGLLTKAFTRHEMKSEQEKKDARLLRRRLRVSTKAPVLGASPRNVTYEYKLARLALDILRNVFQKQEALRTSANIAGLVPLLNDAFLSEQPELKQSALRLLILIIKVPSPQLDGHLAVYISEAVLFLKASPTTNDELAQASIKLVTSILKDRRDVDLDSTKLNSPITYLLRRLRQDVEEPNRQGAAFNFLKAVLARRIIIPEVYDMMDTVASVMVTNYTRETREMARGTYVTFIMEYPQGKDRFAKQLKFLVRNLQYQYPEGRQSVLEAIHSLLLKVGEVLVQDIIATVMVPLVMVLVNDDDSVCRQMAGTLLREVFERANDEKISLFLTSVQNWIDQDAKPLLVRAALQCYGFYFETRTVEGKSQIPDVQARLEQILKQTGSTGEDSHWELVYYSLCLLLKWCQLYPSLLFNAKNFEMWSLVATCLSFPHSWVKLSAAKLAGLYFADFARANDGSDLSTLPLPGSDGLQMGPEEMLMWVRRHLKTLESGSPSQELAMQVVRNLVFLGRCIGANGLDYQRTSTPAEQAPLPSLEGDAVVGEDEEESESDPQHQPQQSALQYLFSRLSAILRREIGPSKMAGLTSKTASLQLVAALSTHLRPESLRPCLPTIIFALHHLTDDSIPEPRSSDPDFTTGYRALRSTSHEILDLLQKSLGVSELVSQHQTVQGMVKERRDERRRKRRIDAVTDPDRVQRQKRKKDVIKKVKRKEKAMEQRGKRRGW
ncbi:MAG: WD domain protein [Watsoniomyces obsoletus]|nr:MAG: WD domain protein [Watsoniomyces obsoletus]